jgi:hypothetical protein
MTGGEIVGFLAAVLMFMTFYMRTMVPLRVVAIASNIAFLSYAMIEHLLPIFVLHCVLLPLNLLRLYQMQKLVREIRQARTDDLVLDPLLPFMTRQRFKAGETLFRRGEPSHEMFYVRAGVIRLAEIGRTVSAGEVLARSACSRPA